eukprot:g10034.t1
MPQRKMPGQALAAVTVLAVAALAQETRPMVGLDLVEDRTAEMMESMKADMSINFMEAALLQAVVPGGGHGAQGSGDEATRADMVFPSYSLTDVDGVVHTCTVREEPEKAVSSGKKSATPTVNSDISAALDPLDGSCATLPRGYWSYKWCHRKSVIQFHENEDSTTVINLGTYTRTEVKRANTNTNANARPTEALVSDTPDAKRNVNAGWEDLDDENVLEVLQALDAELDESLEGRRESWLSRHLINRKAARGSGHKPKSDDPFQGINDFSELAAVFDFYEGGDVCEETGTSRSLKTSITCCATNQMEADGQATSPTAILVSIQEISVCSYLAQVCSRLLCPAATDEREVVHGQGKEAAISSGVAVASVGHRLGGVFVILQQLEACFPPKKDSWWSYKLCLSTGISQYHEDLFQKNDGSLVAKVTDTFSLGTWDKSTVTGEGEDLIHPSEHGTQGEGGTIVLEFTGGTECDLTGVLRSSTVHLKCGSMQEVREVIEDRTCHYRILALSPLLCSHPALMPKKAAVRTVERGTAIDQVPRLG